MRFASLGSGSRGNATVVEAGSTRLLIDCGFGPRELAKRLGRLGLEPEDLAAILVTHEHSDHAAGVARCAARFGLRVLSTPGTRAALDAAIDGAQFAPFDGHAPFALGDIEVRPFPVPHDAREPVQFVFGDGARRVGLVTDAGCVTPHIVAMLDGCDAVVVECNHDAEMLRQGGYPWPLKQRIAGRFGHLDNRAAAQLLSAIDRGRLQHVVAAHLSEQNNTPELAGSALAEVLGCERDWVTVASQDAGFGWRELA